MTMRLLGLLVAVLGVAYLGLLSFVYLNQDRDLYPAPRFTAEYATIRSQTEGLDSWPRGEVAHRGYLAEPATGSPSGTIIVFHGNATTALDSRFFAEAFNRLGYRVLLAEYPGYADRPGNHGESALVSDALSTFDLARREFDGPLYIVGNSLGAAVGAAVVHERGAKVSGVALIVPWDSLWNWVREGFPFVPAKLPVKSKYDSVRNLSSYGGPVAVAIATQDELIPNSLSTRLYESLPGPKRLWRFEGAGHNTWPSSPEAAWWSELVTFWDSSGGP